MRRRLPATVLALAAALLTAATLGLPGALGVVHPGPPPIPIGPTPRPSPPAGAVAATLSSATVGAHPVTLTLSFRTALVCGRPLGPVVVHLPAELGLPASIPPSAVTINGRAAGGVRIAGHVVTVRPPALHGVMCDSVVLGTESVTFTRLAGLVNPHASGSYDVLVEHARETLHGSFRIG